MNIQTTNDGNFSIGSFNVRGLTKNFKQQQLARDAKRYGVDLVCLQELKIKHGDVKSIDNNYNLVALPTTQKAYGNGFLISKNLRVHRLWKVSDRICVIQLVMKEPPQVNNETPPTKYKTILNGSTMKIMKQPPKYTVTIINVYGPTTKRVIHQIDELDQFYTQLSDLVNSFSNLSTAMTFVAGDFNAKIGKRVDELCMGNFSRGRRNNSGEMCLNFCEMNQLFVCNSAFRHPARHITTWSREYFDKTTRKKVVSYNQIDYILMSQNQKHILTDSRSYSGTETQSDHRLVVSRLDAKWFKIYKNKPTVQHSTKRFNTDQLTSSTEVKEQYQNLLSDRHQNAPDDINKWERLKSIITTTAEETIGYKPHNKNHQNRSHDNEIHELSLQKKQLHIQSQNSTNYETVQNLKHQCNQISHDIRSKIKRNHDQKLNSIIDDIEGAHSDSKMFKAVQNLNRKSLQNQFVHDKEGKLVTNPQGIHDIIREHFNNHFYNPAHQKIPPYLGIPKTLDRRITLDQIKLATSRMTNNRAPGFDNIAVELVKYAPDCILSEIAEILNNAIEMHQPIQLGKGQLAALWKPGKTKGPVVHMRPIILLIILRKILSNVTLNRIKPNIESYLSASQSAYRCSRSTTDVVWSYRWMLAKIQRYTDLELYITGIDMSSAFDTINRQELLDVLDTFVDEDEVRMIRLLLSDTTLEIKINGAETEPFESNVGSPQGDGISGPLFNIYFESALRKLRELLNHPTPMPHSDHGYSNTSIDPSSDHDYSIPSDFPPEMIYADDADFIGDSKVHQISIDVIAPTSLKRNNLNVNTGKTEHLTLKRGNRDTELWRNAKKLGSLLGDVEDIARRKQLAIVAMHNMNKLWLKKHTQVSLYTRLKLFNALVKSVLLYNCACWGLRKADIERLNGFHRQLLRRMCRIFWPHTISSKKLYRFTKTRAIIIDITRARWKYFGHALRLPEDAPPKKAMRWYFMPELFNQQASGGQRTTIVTTLQTDIKDARTKFANFEIRSLASLADYNTICQIASNRKNWMKITKTVVDSAKAKYSNL